jgi:hypothetical protein
MLLPYLIEPHIPAFVPPIVAGLVQLWNQSSRFRFSGQHE